MDLDLGWNLGAPMGGEGGGRFVLGRAGMGRVERDGLDWVASGAREGLRLTAMGERKTLGSGEGSWGETSREHRLVHTVCGSAGLRVLFVLFACLCS